MEHISLGHRYKECKPWKNSSCPTKILVEKDILKELEHRRSSTSVIAKLMGIDVLPPSYVDDNRHQEFKDVFEVSEESHEAVTKERSHHFPKGLPSLKRIEINNPLFEKRPHDVNYSPNHLYEKDTAGLGKVHDSGNTVSTPDTSHINKNLKKGTKQVDFSMLNRERVSQNLLDTEDVNLDRIKGERYLTSSALNSLLKEQESSFDQYSTVDTSSTGSSQKCISDEDLVNKSAATVRSTFGSRLSGEQKVSASPFRCCDYKSITISDHTDVAKSRKCLKEVEQPSPVSILELPTDEDSCCSGYFKNDFQDMPNVEKLIDDSQLQYEEVSMSSDDDNDSFCQSLEALLVEEEMNFSYLLDILISSGMIVADLQLLCKSWHSPGCPVGPHVFDRLERKYNKIAVWPRPERRLLFDLANSVLSEILAPCIDINPWVKSSRLFSSVWGPEGPVEVVWQTIVRQQEEIAVGHLDDKVLDREWLEVADGINMVGKQIAKMLHGDLLDEVILEFLSGCATS
ncbi:hypothetical protein GUJ93_ZPchr0003g17404 [Zizania palustris]|uniref:DUF4378 domain-containing protein n=1 Tax=Zizania palustris TaxID=103762 RepID=A0A8J5VYL0_ZIZPA|nr:hypothetical protein GUJ93_ZPchr0003g17404 [Zizania palustris]